jgi:hypothetical protein
MLGIGKLSNKVFLINFRLAQLFCNPATCRHTMQKNRSGLIGTVHYSSVNCHHGLTPSQHDDLESLMCIIVYLAKGSLPWQGIKVWSGQVHQDKVMRVKEATTVKALCKGLPQHFIQFVEHVQCLGFQGKPDYKYLCSILEVCVVPLPNMN